jgi:hypothetical protein
LFDNAFFRSTTDVGGRIPLSRAIGGKHHCYRELARAPKELQYK